MAEPIKVPKWVLIIHAVQVVFAIIILGLSSYGVHWIPYNALIFALVVCICTFGVCAYLLASQLALHSLYNVYVAIIFHLWMLLFWIVDLGLVANLARLWSGDGYYLSYGYAIDYSSFIKRNALAKRAESTTYQAYYGALAAGAVFAAVEFVSWIATTVILVITWQKHRSDTINANTATQPSQPPPQYAANQAVPMEKYNQTTTQPQPQQVPQQQQPYQQQQQQQQQYQQSFQHQQSYTQQGGPYSQQPGGQFGTPYPQDPVPRQDTVSPVSSAAYGYAPTAVSELGTPPTTGATYPPNASELGPASHQQQRTVYDANVPELADRK